MADVVIEGVDYLADGPTPAQLVAAGKHFTLGYIDRPDSGLTAQAIADRHAAGLDVGLIAEWGSMRMGAGAPAGSVDGARAKKALDALGAPAGTVVYFAADWDVARSQYSAVEAYLAAVKPALAPYRAGLYGGLDVVSHVQAAGTVAFFWQTYAWSLGQWAAGVQLQQYHNGQSIGGAPVDFDRAMVAEWGQWKAGIVVGLSVKLAATASASAPWSAFGTAKVSGSGHSAIRVSDRKYVPVAAGQDLGIVQLGALTAPLDSAAGNRTDVYVTNINGEEHAVLRTDATFTAIAPPVPPVPPTVTYSFAGQNVTVTGPK